MNQAVLPITIYKVCTKCGESKTIDLFATNNKRKYGKSSWCKECFNGHNKKTDKFRKRNSNKIDKIRYLARRRKWFKDHPEIVKSDRKKQYEKNRLKTKDDNLRRSYGITLEEYNRLSVQQENKCGVCKAYVETLHVDHCHSTGKIRGLVCNNCNRGIGLLGDTIEDVCNALEYLRKSMA